MLKVNMNLLFINPSLRPGSDHLFLPVGLGYVVTYIKKAGYDFKILDIDAHQLSDEYVKIILKKIHSM